MRVMEKGRINFGIVERNLTSFIGGLIRGTRVRGVCMRSKMYDNGLVTRVTSRM